MANRDPEPKVLSAGILTYAGYPDIATRLLRAAVDQNYCAVPNLENDPLLAPVRSRPEFPAILAKARQCQQKFLAHRGQ